MRFSKEDERKRFDVVRAMAALGPRRVVSEAMHMRGTKRAVYVKCSLCRKTYEVLARNILNGRIGCICRRGRGQKYNNDPRAHILWVRYNNMKRRCNNPNNPSWPDYGRRGIENRFRSCEHYVKWVLKNLPHPDYKGVEIDRKDNDGHYEPGNLRLVTHRRNANNKRNNVWYRYCDKQLTGANLGRRLLKDYPSLQLTHKTICRYLGRGVPWQKIVGKL